MILRQRVGDGGYYLVGPPIPGGPIITYQISEEGVRYLNGQGVEVEDRASPSQLETLRNRGDIWTLGGGVDPPPPPAPPILDPDQIRRLTSWARREGDEDVEEVFQECGLPPNRWYELNCLAWFSGLENGIRLSELAGVSRRDLADACRAVIAQAPQFYGELFGADGGELVVWRFASIIGRVALIAEQIGDCPCQWSGKLGERLFSAIRAHLSGRPDGQQVRRTRFRYEAPVFCWNVYDQEIVWHLPEQKVPRGTGVSWETEEGIRTLSGRPENGICVVKATNSAAIAEPEIMDASAILKREVRYTAREEVLASRVSHVKVQRDQPLLFSEAGVLVCPAEDDSIAPGGYFALVPPDAPSLENVHGVEIVDRSLMEPVCWWDWEPLRIKISPGSRVGAFECVEVASASWRLDGDPLDAVEPSYYCPPIFVNKLPAVRISNVDDADLEDAFAEITCEASRKPLRPFLLATSVRRSGDDQILDLNDIDRIVDVFGRFTLRMVALRSGLSQCEPLMFIRLPEVAIEYVPDPSVPDYAYGLRLAGGAVTLSAENDDTIIVDIGADSAGHPVRIARSSDPFVSPEVCLRVAYQNPSSETCMSIKIPVTRVSIIDRSRSLPRWKRPPKEVDLSSVGHDKKLRVQLHEPPERAADELYCRLVPGNPIAGGKATKSQDTFEIHLSRWRDELGPRARGDVHVRCRDGWLPLVALVGDQRARAPRAPVGPSILSRIDEAILNVDEGSIINLANEAISQVEAGVHAAAHAELLFIKASRAFLLVGQSGRVREMIEGLDGRSDMPEADLVRVQALLRDDQADSVLIHRIRNEVRQWPEGPFKDFAKAECWYRMSRLPNAGSEALTRAYGKLNTLCELDEVDELQAQVLALMISFSIGHRHEIPQVRECSLSRRLVTVSAAISICNEYCRTVLSRWRKLGPAEMDCHEPLPCLIDQNDLQLLKACCLQASREMARAGECLDSVPQGYASHWLNLLRARQAKLEGRLDDAIALYRPLLRTYEVAIDEIP